jgi:PAS domain S-box-containing protein
MMENTHTDQCGYADAGLFDNALVMIVVLDKRGKIIAWNHAAETITGYSPDSVIGTTHIWRQLYPDQQYRNSVTKKITEILSHRKYFENLETTIRTKSGDSRIILWNTKEVVQDGETHVIAVGMDVTNQREADAFRVSIIDNANVFIAVLDSQGYVIIWNRAAESITGYPRNEVIGRRDIWKHLYPDAEYRRTITRRITGIIAEHRYFENLETTIVTKTGGQRIISWNTRQIGFHGAVQEIAIGRDITGQKRAEEALVAYMTEMAMRIKQPIEIIHDNLQDIVDLTRSGKITTEEMMMSLESQIRNAAQISANVQEFQKAIVENNTQIPDAYHKFLEG